MRSSKIDLGLLYCTGDGVGRSFADAIRRFERAAAQGFAKARIDLGVMTMLGQATPTDHDRARDLLHLAAADGDPNAGRTLASIYREGEGAPWREPSRVAAPPR